MMNRLNCEQVDWVLRSGPLEQISEEQLRAIEDHLSDCALCRDSWQGQMGRKGKSDVSRDKATPHGPEAINAARGQVPRRSIKFFLVATALVMLPIPVSYVFGIAKDAARGADSQAAMKQFGLIFEEYANQSEKEKWPVLTPMDEVWVPKLEPLHGAFSTNTQIMVSIYHPDKTRLQRALLEAWNQPVPDFANAARIFGESFAYLGFMVQSESEFETLWLARTQHAILPDGTLPSTFNPGTVLPLREGVERFLTTDINGPNGSPSAQAPIPVLIEIADWKYKESDDDFKGANVLYMDGHVAFVPLGTFPVLPSILDVLSGS